MSFLNQADQVSNLESSFTETVRISSYSILNEKDWKRNTANINRMKGKACIGFPRLLSGQCKMFLVRKVRWAALVTPESAWNKKRRDVILYLNRKRQSLFDEFWPTMSWDFKNMFVCSTVDIKSTKQKTVKGDGMRQRKSP
ncbi:hypothetical protein AVEN_174743-1 [Araneus ventricosus]|uniref:Uncharacterized protein n=1 Tax=Araneus ventricosus TaxID=182803 RepID=A0A4Y2BJM8_ARAVE|nr:hypothetical protein AVEN_174743-1 [Araneus ventricosus]